MLTELPESLDSMDLAPAGKVHYWPCAVPELRSEEVFERLRRDLDWRQLPVRMFGRAIPQPRLTDFRADQGVCYRYSGLALEASPWSADLAWMRQIVQERTGHRFNSVLCNLYRDGRDYMGWHADDEPELGPEPVIASLSFGACRRFLIKSRSGQGRQLEFKLESGSLLVMSGDLQHHWVHQLPRALGVHEARINLTFRNIRN